MTKNTKTKRPTKSGLNRLLAFPFPCPACDETFLEAKLFCSEACAQGAQWVRYVRARQRDGRFLDPEIQEGIQLKLAMVLGGGYQWKERRLSEEIRKAVFKRDKGRCRKCRRLGNEIDHVRGSSSALKNLQLLCHACHVEKTKASLVEFTPESNPAATAHAEALWCRVTARAPLFECDSEQWISLWGPLRSHRLHTVKMTGRDSRVAE